MTAQTTAPDAHPGRPPGRQLAGLSLGIVYGDIGTSPLYSMHECFHASQGVQVTSENILGVLSLIFWALIVIVTLKLGLFGAALLYGDGVKTSWESRPAESSSWGCR